MSETSEKRVIKLNDYETQKFLELYAVERLLYDTSSTHYKDKDKRLAAANRIATEMGIFGFGPKEVIAKFKNLRSSYCQELKKIADSEMKSVTGTEDVYIPKVFWFQTMNSFIRPFVQQRQTKSNLVIPTNQSSPVSVQEDSQQEESIPSITKSPEITINDGQNAKMKEEHPPNFKRTAQPETWSSKRKKNSQDPQLDGMLGAIEKLEAISSRAAGIPKEDSYDYFGKYVSSMLRTIGPPTAMRLQEQITHLITQAMCPPPPPTSSSCMSSIGTPSHSALSDYSDD